MSAGKGILLEPNPPAHMILAYDGEGQKDDAIIDFLNSGLERDQLCVYGSVNLEAQTVEKLYQKIPDLDERILNGNMFLMELKPYERAALDKDFVPFEGLKEFLVHKSGFRKDRFIRFVGDLVSVLYMNGYFEQCFALESWWHKRPFVGSYLCPYPNSVLNVKMLEEKKKKVLELHDVVVC